jgi:hypothetical protein
MTCEADKNTCRVLLGKPEGKISVGRRSVRYIRMNVTNNVGGCRLDSTGSGQGQMADCVNTVYTEMNFQFADQLRHLMII